MIDCNKGNHLWHVTDWVTPEIAYKRTCLLCHVKQKREYLGGSMWRWHVVKPDKT